MVSIRQTLDRVSRNAVGDSKDIHGHCAQRYAAHAPQERAQPFPVDQSSDPVVDLPHACHPETRARQDDR
jgi:hypothetical protein